MSFEDIAPTIFGLGVTQAQADTFFENKIKPPAPPVVPEITKSKAVAIAQAIYVTGIEKAGGVKKLAQSVGLQTSQVKLIISELRALEAAWSAEQEEPIE